MVRPAMIDSATPPKRNQKRHGQKQMFGQNNIHGRPARLHDARSQQKIAAPQHRGQRNQQRGK